jgi:hypothetical protein
VRIVIETIPHKDRRYKNTVGDWQFDKKHDLTIRVSDTGDWRFNACLIVHELIEALLCENNGCSTQQVDDFDMNFKGDGEPGDDLNAPYHLEHTQAEAIEMIVATFLHADWIRYGESLNKL